MRAACIGLLGIGLFLTPAPACKPPEPRRMTVETTPSGVEIVRGPGPNAPGC
jgi:hypothetical protein